MEVLLVEDYPSLGYVGDTVAVKRGHARNYLIPRGIAVDVGSRRAKEFQHIMKGVTAKRSRLKSEAEALGESISKEKLKFDLKVGAGGKAFGSVTARDALEQLEKLGYKLERKQVRLADAIKAAGDYVVAVQLHAEVTVEVPVEVTGIKEKVSEESAKGRRGKGRGKQAAEAEGEEGAATEEALAAAEAVESGDEEVAGEADQEAAAVEAETDDEASDEEKE